MLLHFIIFDQLSVHFFSNFSDIFDEGFFIQALKNNVKVARKLPEDVLQRYEYNISSIVNLRVKAWSSPAYYLQKVIPKMKELRCVTFFHT